MILRLLMYVFAYAAAAFSLFAGAAIGYRRLFKEKIERHKKIAEGKKRLGSLTGPGGSDLCGLCFKPINPDVDVYSDVTGWAHSGCYTSEVIQQRERE